MGRGIVGSHGLRFPQSVGGQPGVLDTKGIHEFIFHGNPAPFGKIEVGIVGTVTVGMPHYSEVQPGILRKHGGDVLQRPIGFRFDDILVYVEIYAVTDQFALGEQFIPWCREPLW